MFKSHCSTWFTLAILIITMMMNTGCAFIAGGLNQDIPLQSNPNGATVEWTNTDDGSKGILKTKTPLTTSFYKGNTYILRFSHEGYESAELQITPGKKSTLGIVDLVLSGFAIVGGLTGGGWPYYAAAVAFLYSFDSSEANVLIPEYVSVSLNKISAVPGPAEIKIVIGSDSGNDSQNSEVFVVDSSVPGVELEVIPLD